MLALPRRMSMIATCHNHDPLKFNLLRRFLIVVLLAAGVSGLLVRPASAVTNTLISDTWKDGNDTEPAAPQYAENNGFNGSDADGDGDKESVWFQGGNGSLNPLNANSGPLRGDITGTTASATWSTYLTPEGSEIKLAQAGDSVKLTWVFSLTNVNASNTSQNLHIG